MKKNKMLRTASVLLILVMLTTSIIGGTFAKYVTTGTASDTARVAKWGVVINTSGSLYSDAYAIATAGTSGADGNLPADWTVENPDATSITVASKIKADNIVAPGTKSYDNGLSFSISGTPEVAVEVKTTIKAEDIFLKAGKYGVLVPAAFEDDESLQKAINAYTDGVYSCTGNTYTKLDNTDTYDGNLTYYILTDKVELTDDYYPVEYTLDGTTNGPSDTAVKVADKLAKVVKNSASADSGNTAYKATYTDIKDNFAANTDLATAGPKFGDEKLSWEWPIGTTAEDPKDTILGDLMAARNGAVDYVVVSVGTGDAVTALTIETGDDDYTVKNGADVVANLRTQFEIVLTVTQVD